MLKWLLLAGAVVLAALAYSPILELGFTGEDFVVFHRLGAASAELPQAHRPLLDLYLHSLLGLFGTDSPAPFFAATLGLHLLCCALVFTAILQLGANAVVAAAGAVLFGVGAGGADSLAWIAAVNRPLSALGALLAINGLLLLERWPRRGALVLAAGIAWQYFHAEVHGTLLLVLAVLLARSLRGGLTRRARATLLGGALGAIALMAAHFLWMRGSEGQGLLGGGMVELARRCATSGWTRYRMILAGWGLAPALSPWVLVAATLLLLRCGLAVALFTLAWTLSSLVPYVLANPLESYRHYPSQAPLAAMGALALAGIFAAPRCRCRRPAAIAAAAAILIALAWLGSSAPRTRRLAQWRGAAHEISACYPSVKALAAQQPGCAVSPINLEASTLALFSYFGLKARPLVCFLDTPHGCVPPPLPPPPLLGRRGDGSYGAIERASLDARVHPHVEPYRLYLEVRPSSSYEEARALLDSAVIDIVHQAVVEAPPGCFTPLRAKASPGAAPPGLEVLQPFTPHRDEGNFARSHATCEIRVSTPRWVVVAVQPYELFWDWFRLPREYAVINHVVEARTTRFSCRVEGGGPKLRTFFLNGMGSGVLVPPGTHHLHLRWDLRSLAESSSLSPG